MVALALLVLPLAAGSAAYAAPGDPNARLNTLFGRLKGASDPAEIHTVEGAILALNVDEVSQPFRSPLGYHVFKLEAKDSLEGDGLVRIRQQVRDILFREKYDTRLEVWLKEIRQRAIIEVRL